MTSEALPLVLATVFTAGCVAIQKAGRHAEAVGHVLGILFSVVVALLIVAVLAQVMPQVNGSATSPPREAPDPRKLTRRLSSWGE